MGSKRRLVAALDRFVHRRREGVRSKKHLMPLMEFASAELRARGVRDSCITRETTLGRFYRRKVDLVVQVEGNVSAALLLITQSGSVRKNLNNRRRDIVGDAINLRAANPDAAIAVMYLLTADEEATRRGGTGTSPVDELAHFLTDLQHPAPPFGGPLLDAAALIAANQDSEGRICMEVVPSEVDVLGSFFDRIVALIPGELRT